MTYCIAHRGGTGLRPENTLAAFQHGISLGADGVELDVLLTTDDIVVVHHDPTLNPATTRSNGEYISERKLISDLSYDELSFLDVGRCNPQHPYAKRHPDQVSVDGECIPTLDQVLDVLPEDKWLLCEIKSSVTEKIPFDEVERQVKATLGVLRRRNRLNTTIFLAFDWRALAVARQI